MHGDSCSTDYDCNQKTFCWYKYPQDVAPGFKRCLNKYSQDPGINFGWVSQTGNALDDAIINGQFCKTGWAWNSNGGTTGKCTQITRVDTDLGTEMKTPLMCTANLDNNYCKYYLDNSLTNYLQGLCECALDSNPGFCRYPT